MELNLKERKKLTAVAAKKYRRAKKDEKTKTLSTFTEQAGYNRKYATHIPAKEGKAKPAGKKARAKITHKAKDKRAYPVTYDKAVQGAPAPAWEAFNRQCGKPLAPFLHGNIDGVIKYPKFNFGNAAAAKLRKVSAPAIGRPLKPGKAWMGIKGAGGTGPAAKHLKGLIPAPSHFGRKEQGGGLWQIGLAQHGGGNPSGECGL
jgi:hypothetical protein